MNIQNNDACWKIQQYVSQFPYNPKNKSGSVKRVLAEEKAHCFEGAILAASLLEPLGHEAQLLHLRSHRDDDHVVALFQKRGKWGAIGKSNTTLLSWREPIYRDLRELTMSYFPFYFNTKGQMSLIGWAGPIRLDAFKKWNWRDGLDDIHEMSAAFYRVKHQKIMTIEEIEKLPKAPKLLVDACFLGADSSGLYKT